MNECCKETLIEASKKLAHDAAVLNEAFVEPVHDYSKGRVDGLENAANRVARTINWKSE